MRLLLQTRYIYDENGQQEFIIEVYQDGDSCVGRGLTVKGVQITNDVRVSAAVEEAARLDAIGAVANAVQGLIIGLIHAHSTKGGLHKS